MKYVLFYDSADNVAANAPAQFPAHKARYEDFHARGEFLMLVTFADPSATARWRSSQSGKPPRSSPRGTFRGERRGPELAGARAGRGPGPGLKPQVRSLV